MCFLAIINVRMPNSIANAGNEERSGAHDNGAETPVFAGKAA